MECLALGIDRCILCGYPRLEECYRVAEPAFPLQPTHRVDRGPERNAGSFGEVSASLAAPSQRARHAAG